MFLDLRWPKSISATGGILMRDFTSERKTFTTPGQSVRLWRCQSFGTSAIEVKP
jgi:hypothetical protein